MQKQTELMIYRQKIQDYTSRLSCFNLTGLMFVIELINTSKFNKNKRKSKCEEE